MGGINASLQLLNYKIDGISFEHSSSVNFILNNQFDPKKIKTSVSLRVPQKLKNTDNYICGLTMIVEYGSNVEDTYFKVSMSIVGFFVLRKEEIEIKNNLDIDMFLKTQPLAILSPYLRASLTSFLISAGVTQFVFPLINMKKLAEQHLADKKNNRGLVLYCTEPFHLLHINKGESSCHLLLMIPRIVIPLLYTKMVVSDLIVNLRRHNSL